MLDPRLLREHPDRVEAREARGSQAPLQEFLDVDGAAAGRCAKSRSSRPAGIGSPRRSPPPSGGRSGRDRVDRGVPDARRRYPRAGPAILALDGALAELALQFPNVPHPDVPPGAVRRRERRDPAAGASRASFASRPGRTGSSARSWGSSTPSAAPGSRSRASPCSGDGGAARARARAAHARPPHQGARVPGSLGPAPRQRRDDARHRPAPEVRGGPVQDRRARGRPGALPDPHGRGAAHGHACGRDPAG